MIDKAELDRMVSQIVAGYAPLAIGLFGSHAVGMATDQSDLDLVVIKRTTELERRRAARVRHLIASMRKIDVVVLTPEELALARRAPHTFHYTVAEQLKLIYLRPGVERAELGL